MLDKIKNWIIYSSANHEKYSRTLKAGLLALSPTIAIAILFLFGYEISQESLGVLIGEIVEAFGAFLTVVYLVAKIYNTVVSYKQI